MYYFINLQIKHLDLGKTENKFYIFGAKVLWILHGSEIIE